MSQALVDGELQDATVFLDRGLAYGDGVFETIRVIEGQPVLLALHMKRLLLGCERLRLQVSKALPEQLSEWIDRLLDTPVDRPRDLVVKVIVTRGAGGRGYRPSQTAPRIVVSCHALPPDLQRLQQYGMRVKILEYRLPRNPVLAGLKHLNRLDQVLASMELGDEDEGIVLDSQGLVTEGTKSNIFLFTGSRIVTPDLSQCGVQGVLRDYILEQADELGLDIQVQPVQLEALYRASGLVMVNSVVGVCPVRQLNDKQLVVPDNIKIFQKALHEKLKF